MIFRFSCLVHDVTSKFLVVQFGSKYGDSLRSTVRQKTEMEISFESAKCHEDW